MSFGVKKKKTCKETLCGNLAANDLRLHATKKLGFDKSNIVGFNHLTPELNPAAQRYLTRFLLGILLLVPCISLIYA
jgi:hypothetical protein